jgi:hypothetical protein
VASGAVSKVTALDKHRGKPAHRGIARYTASGRPASDDENVRLQ